MKIWWICDSGTSYPLRGIPYLGKEGPWICDSGTSYPLRGIPYLGKEGPNSYPLRGIPYLGKEGPNRAENLAQKVVEDLCEPSLRTKRILRSTTFSPPTSLHSVCLPKA
ncbi:hypothetical protein QE152_g23607 [Popillia japonica]|uniref:Uncharacterized protein n=1 Tax=Popillia japonica TaxID=7064 RepID=A0AAW1KH46_POPJA